MAVPSRGDLLKSGEAGGTLRRATPYTFPQQPPGEWAEPCSVLFFCLAKRRKPAFGRRQTKKRRLENQSSFAVVGVEGFEWRRHRAATSLSQAKPDTPSAAQPHIHFPNSRRANGRNRVPSFFCLAKRRKPAFGRRQTKKRRLVFQSSFAIVGVEGFEPPTLCL